MEFHTSDRFHADKRKTIMVDIDETISYYEGKRSYDLAKPIQENVDLVNQLYDEGCYIIMWTARGGSESSKKAGRCYYDFTMEQLKSWGVKFHELSTGSKGNYIKPAFDLVLDDKAMSIEQFKIARKLNG
jgi:hypothetical protein